MVIIIDFYIKNIDNYFVVVEFKFKDLVVKNKDGNIFEGWCWLGSFYWIDVFKFVVCEWWVIFFKYVLFKGFMENIWIWNDMNEFLVFNGFEMIMFKDNFYDGNWEYCDVYNFNGMIFYNVIYYVFKICKFGEFCCLFVFICVFFVGF